MGAMSLVALACVLAAPLARQEPERFVFEDRLGVRTEVAASELPLTDPRERGGWCVRPVGAARGAAPAAGLALRVRLVGGDDLLGRAIGGEGEELELELVGGVRLPISIDRIQEIRPAGRESGGEEPSPDGDRLYRATGSGLDRVDGTVEGFTPDGVRFTSRLGERVFPWSEVAALFVEVLEEPARATSDLEVVLDLADGSRLRSGLVRLEAAGCLGVVGGTEVLLPWSAIEELVVDDGTFLFLSDVAAKSEEGRGTPFGDDLGMLWNHAVDRSVTGEPLRVGGTTYRRGFGTHAPTRLAFELDPRFTKLRGSVGVDDSSLSNPEHARGSVRFRVLLDGKVAFESHVVRGGDAPLELPVLELAGARELVLEADPVEDHRGDRADWLRFVLVE
jgi:hypothetical protein